MFVSVTERTKEIGIRKAIGAKKKTVLVQFLFEAAFLCFVGALISLVLCSILVFGITLVIPNFFPNFTFLSPYLPIDILLQATFISVIVGMIAGIAPAIKAANLTPIDALRFE
jgi:putative ABC transport system permease protein